MAAKLAAMHLAYTRDGAPLSWHRGNPKQQRYWAQTQHMEVMLQIELMASCWPDSDIATQQALTHTPVHSDV